VRLAVVTVAAGTLASLVAALVRVQPAFVLTPLSLSLLVAAVVVPFPAADYLLCGLLIGTLPLLPTTRLPNMPLAAGVVVVAFARVGWAEKGRLRRRPIIALAVFWALVGIGSLFSAWPAPSLWLRPVSILALGALASFLGAMVVLDQRRLERWCVALLVAGGVISATAVLFYFSQFVFPLNDAVSWLAQSQAYVRGESAGEFFNAVNNWVIWSPSGGLIRAVSIFAPSPHAVGGFAGLSIPIAFAAYMSPSSSRRTGWFALAIIALDVLALVLSMSRASWLAGACACAVGVVVLAWRFRDRVSLRRAGIAAGTGAAVALLAVGLIALNGPKAAGVGSRVTDASNDPSVGVRVTSDTTAAQQIVDQGFTGYGIGGWGAPGAPVGASYTHNVYLEYGGAVGLLGLCWAISIPGLFALAAFRSRRKIEIDRTATLVFATIGSFAAVHFLFDDSLLNPQYALLLFAATGCAAAFAVRVTAPDQT
jgi:O-antigen ligase